MQYQKEFFFRLEGTLDPHVLNIHIVIFQEDTRTGALLKCINRLRTCDANEGQKQQKASQNKNGWLLGWMLQRVISCEAGTSAVHKNSKKNLDDT